MERLSLPLAVLRELWGLCQPPAGPELVVIFKLVVGLLELLVVVVGVGLDLNSELVGVQPALLVVGAAVAAEVSLLAPVGVVLSVTPLQAVVHLRSSVPLQLQAPPVIVTQSVVMSVSPLMGFMAAAAAGMVIMCQVGLAVLAAVVVEVLTTPAVLAVLAAVVAVVVVVVVMAVMAV